MTTSKYDKPNWDEVTFMDDPFNPKKNNYSVSINVRSDKYSPQIALFSLSREIEGIRFAIDTSVDIAAYCISYSACREFITLLNEIFNSMNGSLDNDIKRRLQNDR
jgi:hypothetical protein